MIRHTVFTRCPVGWGIRPSLREIGMPEDGIDRAADLKVQNPYWNPRPIERGDIRELIARAWAGQAPGT
jgi:maleylacetate reductase